MRQLVPPPFVRPPVPLAPAYGGDPARALAVRWLPAVFALGPLLALAWLLVHPGDGVAQSPFLAAVLIGWATALAVLAGVLDVRSPRVLHALATLGTLLISITVCAGAGDGLGLLYVWAAPTAFVLFPLRAALAHCALSGAAYVGALAVLAHRDDAPFPQAADVRHVLLVVATMFVVGGLVRTLGTTLTVNARVLADGFHSAPFGMLVLDRLRIVEANDAFCRLVGRPRSAVLGSDILEITHPDDVGRTGAEEAAARAGVSDSVDFEKRYVRPDGTVVWARVISTLARPERSSSRLFVTQVVDLTDQRRAQQERERARRRDAAARALSRAAVSERAPHVVMVRAAEMLARELDATHVAVVEVEPDGQHVRCVAGVGWPPEDFGDTVFPAQGSHAGLALQADGPVVLGEIDAATVPSSASLLQVGLRSGVACAIPHPDRPYGVIGVHAPDRHAFDEDDAAFVRNVAEILSSAVQRAEAEEHARHATLHDVLTGLPGRQLLETRLDEALDHAASTGRRAGVVLANVDALHLVNDGYGHDIGDEVLRELAARVVGVAGSRDDVARIAGDELAVVCEGPDDEAIITVAERLLAAVRAPIDATTGELLVTASAGVAIAGERGQRAETLLREADVAVDRAKQLGRDRVEVYDEFAHRRALERLRLQTDLRDALGNGELRLVYQPIVDLDSGGTYAVEALLRWEHLVRGPISPAEFIPVAESSGLIVPIGEFVVREACAQAAAWEAAGRPLQVTINVSVHQLRRRGFAAIVRNALRGAGIGPERLAIEITESALMEARDAVLAGELQALHDLGVAVHLDDFGTGYSSLSSLRDLRLHAVKIDRSFVAGLEGDEHAAPILRAMTTMAGELGLRVIAEGVETEGERALVAELGCDAAQGYLFSPPVPPGQLDAQREQPLV